MHPFSLGRILKCFNQGDSGFFLARFISESGFFSFGLAENVNLTNNGLDKETSLTLNMSPVKNASFDATFDSSG